MRNHTIASILLLVLALASPAAAEIVSGIAATVNDDVITIYEVNRETAQLLKEAEKRGPVTDAIRQQVRTAALNALIDKRLVQEKIKELNIQVSEEEVRQAVEEIKKQNNMTQDGLVAALLTQGLTFDQYKAQLKEQLERIRLMGQEVRAKIQVSDREIQDYYTANKTNYSEDETYRARHIFFRVPKDAAAEQVKEAMSRAANVLMEARSGKDFAELARKHSDETSAAKDAGDLGSFRKGEMLPEIETTVIAMKPGEVSELIATPAGFHIIKLEEKAPAKIKPLEEVRGAIEELLYRKKSEERFNQWTTDLRKAATVEVKQ